MLHATPHLAHRRVPHAKASARRDDAPGLASPRAGRTGATPHTSRRMRKFKHFFVKSSHPQWRHRLGERVKADGAGVKLTHAKAYHSHMHTSSSVRAYPAGVIAAPPPPHMNASRFKKFVQRKLSALRARHPHRDRGEIRMLPIPTTQLGRHAAAASTASPSSSYSATATPTTMVSAFDIADRTADDTAMLMATWDGLDRVAPAECGYELRLTDCAEDVPDTLQEYLGLLDPTYHATTGRQDSVDDGSSSYSSSFSLTPPSPELQLLRDGTAATSGGGDGDVSGAPSARHGGETIALRSPPPLAPRPSSAEEGGNGGGRGGCASFAVHAGAGNDPYLLLLRQRAVIEKYLLMLWILTDYLKESYQQEQRNRAFYTALHSAHCALPMDATGGAGSMAYAGYARRLARSRARRARTVQCAKETANFWLRRINLSYAFEDIFADATRLLDAMTVFGPTPAAAPPSGSGVSGGNDARRRFLGSRQVLEAEQVHVQQLSSRLRSCWESHLRLRQDMIEFETLQPRNAAEVLRLSGLTRERFRGFTTPFRQCCRERRETMTDITTSNSSSSTGSSSGDDDDGAVEEAEDEAEQPLGGAVPAHEVNESTTDGGTLTTTTTAVPATAGAAGVLRIEVSRSQSDILEKGERSGPFTYESGEVTSRGTPASALRREESGAGRTARHVTFALDSPSSVESGPCSGHQRLNHLSPAPLALCAAASGLPGAQKLVKDNLERMEEVLDYFIDVCAMKERQLAEGRHEFARRQAAGGNEKGSEAAGTAAPVQRGAGRDGDAGQRQCSASDLSRESGGGEGRTHGKGLRHGKGNVLGREKGRGEERRQRRSPKQSYTSSCFVV